MSSKEGESEAECSLNVTLRAAQNLLGGYKIFYHERLGGRPNVDIGALFTLLSLRFFLIMAGNTSKTQEVLDRLGCHPFPW